MKSNRIVSFIVATLVLVVIVAACSKTGDGGTTRSDNKTTISFMGWGSPQEVAVFQTMIAQFEAKFPGVKVEYTNVPVSDFNTKLQTLIAAKQIPDVFYLQPENVMPWANNGILYDMTGYVADNAIFNEDNVWAKALDMYRYDGRRPGVGNIYGLPKDIGPFALAYNKNLFKAAGIPDPDPDKPWTWDEYITNAKKLTRGTGANKVFGSAPYSVEAAVWSNGADWLDDSKTKVTIDSPAFIEAIQWVADLILAHGVVPSAEEEGSLGSFQRWIEGKIGMMGIGPWSQGQFWEECAFEWDIMPWPVSPSTGKNAIWYGGMGFAAAASSGNIEAACNLAAFLAFNEDAQRTNYQMGQAIPNLIDMTRNEYLAMDKPPQNKQEFVDIIENYGRRATQTYTYNSEWFTEFNANIASVWLGEMSARDYCNSIKGEMQTMLDKGIAEQKK
ncbi:MAG: sugar ABC transporter substrate-binding protein [Treponema sp.]|jgi:multiple sugar transport system substrate-binding protein|nr:sugar ABC transporter substrate-binding protein [Treponema sp.]